MNEIIEMINELDEMTSDLNYLCFGDKLEIAGVLNRTSLMFRNATYFNDEILDVLDTVGADAAMLAFFIVYYPHSMDFMSVLGSLQDGIEKFRELTA